MLSIFHSYGESGDHSFTHFCFHIFEHPWERSSTLEHLWDTCSKLRLNQQEHRKLAQLEGTFLVKSQGLCVQEIWVLNPGSTADELCDLGQVTGPVLVSVPSSIKGGEMSDCMDST